MSDPFAEIRADISTAVALESSRMQALEEASELPNAVYFSSDLWEGLVFRKGFGYYRSDADVSHHFLLASPPDAPFDLLRHAWELAVIPRKEKKPAEEAEQEAAEAESEQSGDAGEEGSDDKAADDSAEGDSEGGTDQEAPDEEASEEGAGEEGAGAETEEEPEREIEVKLEVSECTLALHVQIFEPDPYWGDTPEEQAKKLARTFFKLSKECKKELEFQPVDDGSGQQVFSSNPALDHGDHDLWDQRIDALATDKGLTLICYKRHFEHERFIPAPKWFDDEFRAAHTP